MQAGPGVRVMLSRGASLNRARSLRSWMRIQIRPDYDPWFLSIVSVHVFARLTSGNPQLYSVLYLHSVRTNVLDSFTNIGSFRRGTESFSLMRVI